MAWKKLRWENSGYQYYYRAPYAIEWQPVYGTFKIFKPTLQPNREIAHANDFIYGSSLATDHAYDRKLMLTLANRLIKHLR